MDCLPFNIEINNHITNFYLKLKNIDVNNFDINFVEDSYKKNNIEKSKYIPETIFRFINNNKSIKTSLNIMIDKCNYTINLYFFEKDRDIIKIYKNIFKIITFLSMFKKNIHKNTNYQIDIYFTNFKKEIDFRNNIIDSFNVNTGLTTSYYNNFSKITIYRQEEWFKVLIHELIHAFNFDFRENYDAFKELKKYYDIDSDFNLNESYVEFWARLINVIYFCEIKSINREKFDNNFKKYFKKEILHSIDSGLKILSLISIHNDNYKENSNVFAYYIITSLLIINYKNFINWCYSYNDNLINIKSDKNIIYKFVNKIIEYNKNDLSIESYLCGNIRDNSLTMTTVNIF